MSSSPETARLTEVLCLLRDQIDEDDAHLARMDIGGMAGGLAREAELVNLIQHLAAPYRRRATRPVPDPAVALAARELHKAAVRHLELVAGARRVVEGVVRRLAISHATAGGAALAVDRSI